MPPPYGGEGIIMHMIFNKCIQEFSKENAKIAEHFSSHELLGMLLAGGKRGL